MTALASPIVAVVGDGTAAEGTAGWALAERLGTALVDAGFRVLTGIPDDQVFGVDTPEQAVQVLRERLGRYRDAWRSARPPPADGE